MFIISVLPVYSRLVYLYVYVFPAECAGRNTAATGCAHKIGPDLEHVKAGFTGGQLRLWKTGGGC